LKIENLVDKDCFQSILLIRSDNQRVPPQSTRYFAVFPAEKQGKM
jgi:hypothetical protein